MSVIIHFPWDSLQWEELLDTLVSMRQINIKYLLAEPEQKMLAVSGLELTTLLLVK